MKCKDCLYKEFAKVNGGPNRYYCTHEDARFARSECEPKPMVCRTKRHSEELTIKNAPRWCPINNKKPSTSISFSRKMVEHIKRRFETVN